MKLVGITTYSADGKISVNKAYTDAFSRAGICPIGIPVFPLDTKEYFSENKDNTARANELAEKLDALVVSGGSDINPILFDEINDSSYGCNIARDIFEMALIKAFEEKGKPIMGICRGFQLLGIYLNAPYFCQDVGLKENHNGTRKELASRNEPAHTVYISGEFQKYMIAKEAVEPPKNEGGLSALPVNSWHHQGFLLAQDVDKMKKEQVLQTLGMYRSIGLKIFARTGILIEGFENEKNIFAVQWHPEEYGNKGLTIQYFIDNYMNKAQDDKN